MTPGGVEGILEPLPQYFPHAVMRGAMWGMNVLLDNHSVLMWKPLVLYSPISAPLPSVPPPPTPGQTLPTHLKAKWRYNCCNNNSNNMNGIHDKTKLSMSHIMKTQDVQVPLILLQNKCWYLPQLSYILQNISYCQNTATDVHYIPPVTVSVLWWMVTH